MTNNILSHHAFSLMAQNFGVEADMGNIHFDRLLRLSYDCMSQSVQKEYLSAAIESTTEQDLWSWAKTHKLEMDEKLSEELLFAPIFLDAALRFEPLPQPKYLNREIDNIAANTKRYLASLENPSEEIGNKFDGGKSRNDGRGALTISPGSNLRKAAIQIGKEVLSRCEEINIPSGRDGPKRKPPILVSRYLLTLIKFRGGECTNVAISDFVDHILSPILAIHECETPTEYIVTEAIKLGPYELIN